MQKPLRRSTCEVCGRTHYSRSPLTRFCGSACQSRNWRSKNKETQAELEQLYMTQEQEEQAKEAA
ncbi:hypothetical protein EQ845_21525 [Pseudomonas putida]|uniref:hypothetical protein n=1 Tax=Pseudomonas putida TaxID=303 RepID=UPI00117B2820|nr:hypothetical protein [Pseudomonas putida]TRO31993.1 hypothetical protein EQ845_21525 [Pseudomonas putida]